MVGSVLLFASKTYKLTHCPTIMSSLETASNYWLSANLAVSLGSIEITNQQISEALQLQGQDRSPEKISSTTGIDRRFVVDDQTSLLDLADCAAANLRANLTDSRILMFTTSYPDRTHFANEFARRHFINPSFSGDFYRYCSGFVDVLGHLHGNPEQFRNRPTTIVSSEIYSRSIPNILKGDLDPTLLQVIFGDGASILHFTNTRDLEILSFASKTFKPAISQALLAPCDFSKKPTEGFVSMLAPPLSSDQFLHMDGREVYRFMKTNVPSIIYKALERVPTKGKFAKEHRVPPIDIVIPHQASLKVIRAIAESVPELTDKFFYDTTEGNYSSVSIPKALKSASDEGLIGEGTTALLVGYGVGLRISAAVVLFK